MSSQVDIYNMALLRIGNGKTIASTSEGSNEANLCNIFYEQCRDYLLRAFPWNFSTKRAVLAVSSATPPTNWTYAYSLPSDYLNIRRIITSGLRSMRSDLKPPFQISTSGSQRILYCDIQTVEIEYTARITDTTLFDPAFVSALAYRLALEIAMPLTVKGEIIQSLERAYMQSVREAAALSMNESQDDPEPDGSFLASREMAGPIPDGRILRG